ncbi:hypothetical protein F5Y16DRAFT_375472 [Xylariaceae sp. FL0255]|nr:hypothetical protein F5Y16DRAFT_375472 [Xylariaceae sp. FL0255]
MLNVLVLVCFWIWGWLDAKYQSRFKAEPYPIPSNPKFSPRDVSLICCTLGQVSADRFARCLHTWLANDPREVIIAAPLRAKEDITKLVEDALDILSPSILKLTVAKRITFVFSLEASKRLQLVEGLKVATGPIIAGVDDHITWPDFMLKGMLACFEDSKVGAVHPTISVDIPLDRQCDDIITAWEACCTRLKTKGITKTLSIYAATDFTLCLVGETYVCRAEILKDPKFTDKYLNEHLFWRGPIDISDDCFITRWLVQNDWKIAVQNNIIGQGPSRTVKETSAFLAQWMRWQRSAMVNYWTMAITVPQVWSKPYSAFKIIERLIRPVTNAIHIWAWFSCAKFHPYFVTFSLLCYATRATSSLARFMSLYPYMWRHIVPLILIDHFYIIEDYVCLATIMNISWGGRDIPGKT